MFLDVKKTVWDLNPLLSGDDDPKIQEKRHELETQCFAFINKWKDRRDYLTDPLILKKALDDYQEWQGNYGVGGDLGYYFDLRSSQNMTDPVVKAKTNQIDDFSTKLWNEVQFFELNLSKISLASQSIFLNCLDLSDYKHFLERIFNRARYQLSQPEERVLNLMNAPASYNWVKMTSGLLAKSTREVIDENQDKIEKNFSEIISLVSHKNKIIRDSAAEALESISEQYADIAEAEINSILSEKKIKDDLRGWARPDGSRHLNDDIDSEVVDILIEEVSNRFDISQKYYKLKAKLLNLEKLEYYERQVPYGNFDENYDFQSSSELVNKVFNKLDPEFSETFLRFLKNGQIDVFPRVDKRSGAFCIYYNLKQPTYVLLNHTDKLSDVLTLAHEMGHAINDELMKQQQNSLNFGSSTATAEVASTFMEDFVIEELIKNSDDEERLSLMMMKLDSDISSIFRQIACYQFEMALHIAYREMGYLSKFDIEKLFKQHMADYMGEAVEQPDFANGWIFWPHIRNFFYVYSYASGLLISKSLQSFVKNDPKFINNVKEFLAAGRSDSPKNIFAKLGVDITQKDFWQSGLNKVEDLLVETTDLAKKLGKI